MKKILLKLRSKFGKSFIYCFAVVSLILARTNNYRCLFFFGNATKTNNVTPDAIQALLDKKRCSKK